MVVKATKKKLEELQGVKEVLLRYNKCKAECEKQGNFKGTELELGTLRQEIAQKRSQESQLKNRLHEAENQMQIKRRHTYDQRSQIQMKVDLLNSTRNRSTSCLVTRSFVLEPSKM